MQGPGFGLVRLLALVADQIRAHLGRYLGPDDSLVVEPLPVNRGWSGWVGEGVREWLSKHLGPES